MVILSDDGVKYIDRCGISRTAARGQDIPQEDYDHMSPMERYAVLCHFASEGDGVTRFESSF